jgi:hypothetical protein
MQIHWRLDTLPRGKKRKARAPRLQELVVPLATAAVPVLVPTGQTGEE